MAFQLSAFVRLPAGTAEALTNDRQHGYRGLGRRTSRAYTRTGEAVLTESVDEALRRLSRMTWLLKPKSLTGMRDVYVRTHAIHETPSGPGVGGLAPNAMIDGIALQMHPRLPLHVIKLATMLRHFTHECMWGVFP
jgi:hypothetical protein